MLGGRPVVYLKTHHKSTVFKNKVIVTDHFYAFMSLSVDVMYYKDCSRKGKLRQLCLI